MKKIGLLLALFFFCMNAWAQIDTGGGGGTIGRFEEIRSIIRFWYSGYYGELNEVWAVLNPEEYGWTREDYLKTILKKLKDETIHVSFVNTSFKSASEPGYQPVGVYDQAGVFHPRTCTNTTTVLSNGQLDIAIVCDAVVWRLETEADLYKLVHHEIASVASMKKPRKVPYDGFDDVRIEQNHGEVSDFRFSSKVSLFVGPKTQSVLHNTVQQRAPAPVSSAPSCGGCYEPKQDPEVAPTVARELGIALGYIHEIGIESKLYQMKKDGQRTGTIVAGLKANGGLSFTRVVGGRPRMEYGQYSTGNTIRYRLEITQDQRIMVEASAINFNVNQDDKHSPEASFLRFEYRKDIDYKGLSDYYLSWFNYRPHWLWIQNTNSVQGLKLDFSIGTAVMSYNDRSSTTGIQYDFEPHDIAWNKTHEERYQLKNKKVGLYGGLSGGQRVQGEFFGAQKTNRAGTFGYGIGFDYRRSRMSKYISPNSAAAFQKDADAAALVQAEYQDQLSGWKKQKFDYEVKKGYPMSDDDYISESNNAAPVKPESFNDSFFDHAQNMSERLIRNSLVVSPRFTWTPNRKGFNHFTVELDARWFVMDQVEGHRKHSVISNTGLRSDLPTTPKTDLLKNPVSRNMLNISLVWRFGGKTK
jgi:hypothetical protein